MQRASKFRLRDAIVCMLIVVGALAWGLAENIKIVIVLSSIYGWVVMFMIGATVENWRMMLEARSKERP